MLLVLDIDGTLADVSKREHFIDKINPTAEDWDLFSAPENVLQDDPIPEAQDTLPKWLQKADEIVLLTGRTENLREITEDWLDEYYSLGPSNPKVTEIIMKPLKDKLKSGKDFKEEIIVDVLLPEYDDITFIDDEEENLEMMAQYGTILKAPDVWEENGLKKAMKILAYSIKPEHLRTLWYEDKDGNFIGEPDYNNDSAPGVPEGAHMQVSRFPSILRETYLELLSQEAVDACVHPEEDVRKTYGWIDGIEGRKCGLCGGSQTKNVNEDWPKKWEGDGSREAFSGESSWPEDLALAIANSGDYSLDEAILISATACSRCMNSLAYDYGLDWGYEEGSEEWLKSNTECQFCKDIEHE